MNGAQKAIKGLAIALAVVIVASVVSACVGAGMILSRVFETDGGAGFEGDEVAIEDDWRFTKLTIELKTASLKIERGDELGVIADEEIVEVRKTGNEVRISEKDFGWLEKWDKAGSEVRIVLPEDVDLEKVVLDMGMGTVKVEKLVAEEVDLSLGAGRGEFNGLKVSRKAKVDGGAGHLVMRAVELKDLDLDMGVGKVEIVGAVFGRSEIDAGLGRLEVNLEGEEEDYKFVLEKGLGSMNLNGRSLGSEETIGAGENVIEIDGGVGAIEIKTR